MSGRLTSIMGKVAATPQNAEAVKARGWRENRILVVDRTDPRLDAADRAVVDRLGEKLYGGG